MELVALLAEAEAASPMRRIEFRDWIAALVIDERADGPGFAGRSA